MGQNVGLKFGPNNFFNGDYKGQVRDSSGVSWVGFSMGDAPAQVLLLSKAQTWWIWGAFGGLLTYYDRITDLNGRIVDSKHINSLGKGTATVNNENLLTGGVRSLNPVVTVSAPGGAVMTLNDGLPNWNAGDPRGTRLFDGYLTNTLTLNPGPAFNLSLIHI